MSKEMENFEKYMEEKFKGIHIQLDSEFKMINDRLEKIEAQVTKTNGRVTILERLEATHVIACPQTAKIEKINDELLEYKAFKKVPKLAIVSVIIMAVMMGVAIYNMNMNIKQLKNQQIIEAQTEQPLTSRVK